MGTRYKFKCSNCGYSANVSGGKDLGFVAVVQTMICNDCEHLVDVLVGRCGMIGPSGDPKYDRKLGLCPKCHNDNVTPWSDAMPCPKCGHTMVNEGCTALWD